jgi:hypothetical protein
VRAAYEWARAGSGRGGAGETGRVGWTGGEARGESWAGNGPIEGEVFPFSFSIFYFLFLISISVISFSFEQIIS